MSFAVTILGSSSAKPTPDRHPSAQAVNIHEQYYLVDAGEGVQQQLVRYGINPLKLRAVFISHLHGDHVYGLFPVISTLGLYGRRTPLDVFAPGPLRRDSRKPPALLRHGAALRGPLARGADHRTRAAV